MEVKLLNQVENIVGKGKIATSATNGLECICMKEMVNPTWFSLQDSTGPKQLHQHTVDTCQNISVLENQLKTMKVQLSKVCRGN